LAGSSGGPHNESSAGEGPKIPPEFSTGARHGMRVLGRASGVGIGAGCLTAILTVVALLAGLWLDSLLDSRPMFTLMFVLGSIPLSLILMVVYVQNLSKRVSQSILSETQKTDKEP
jgi:hypothetical protein